MSLPLNEWIIAGGLVGVFLLMLGETVFPPIPSEVIMPLAGFHAARGDLPILGVVAAGVAGAMLGNLLWYWAARALGAERFRRWAERNGGWTTIGPDDVDAARRWFERHGAAAVGLGRLVPTIRSIISIPAGLARMPLAPFIAWSTVGATVWTAALAGAGYALGSRFAEVEGYLNPVSTVVIAAMGALYLYRLATHRRARR